MEEDELGIQREIGHSEFVTCARCGRPIASQAAALVPADALEEYSEFDVLCPDCQNQLADGEKDLPLTLP